MASALDCTLAAELWLQGRQGKQGDERHIKRTLYRLLGNALIFSNEGGTIRIGAQRIKSIIALSIAGNNVGISGANQKLVFETFRQAASTNRQRSVCLGLSLVKRFIELHGERAQLDFTLGEGTSVACIQPPKQESTEAKDDAAATGNWD